MNYRRIYDALIERGRGRLLMGYKERHHIVPRCLGGGDEQDNLVDLTAEEHYVAHQLLVKLHPDNRSLLYAAQLMATHHTSSRSSNKLYGWLRGRMSAAQSAHMKQKWRDNPWPIWIKGKTQSEETKAKIAASTKKAKTEIFGVSIHAYDLDGSFYKSFPSLMECAKHLGTNPSNVKYTAEGRFGHCKGKQLRYDLVGSLPPYSKPKRKIMRTPEHAANLKAAIKNNRAVCSVCGTESMKSAITRYHKDCKRAAS